MKTIAALLALALTACSSLTPEQQAAQQARVTRAEDLALNFGGAYLDSKLPTATAAKAVIHAGKTIVPLAQ